MNRMSEPEYTPFSAPAEGGAGPEYPDKACSPDSKPPRWYIAARASEEPKVHTLRDGSIVVEHKGRFAKYALSPDGVLTRVRASRKPKG
jgi:hypothetical protein